MENATAPPESLNDLLDRLDHVAANNRAVSVDLIMDELGRRSYGPLLLFAAIIMAAPGVGDIPGVPVVLGLFIFLISAQLLIRRDQDHFWLPNWLLKREVSAEKFRKTISKWLRKPARFIDRFLDRRLEILTGSAGGKAIAIVSILLALSTPIAEFIPFSANGIGFSILFFSLALIARDGLLALMGWSVVTLIIGLIIYWRVVGWG